MTTFPETLESFASWDTEDSQYGLMDKYLNLKFPDAMVKPQGLMHPIMSEHEVEIKVGDDGLGDVGNVSIDSTGALSQKMCALLSLTTSFQDNMSLNRTRSAILISLWQAIMRMRRSMTKSASY